MGLSAGTRLGPYEIVAPIGAGGMGEVYRARDTRLGRDVAVKVLPSDVAHDADRLARFEREAQAVAALSHPNILALYDVGEAKGIRYVVVELLEGETLRERLSKGPLPQHSAVELGVEIAHGLSAAHAKGIVHRDLKPANVFVTSDGVVKILDFGLAKLVKPESAVNPEGTTVAPEPRTESGTVLGTMGYTAPEQLRGEAADARSDIFAFGCVLYEMLSGRSPFLKPTGAETIAAIMSEDPVPLSRTGRAIAPALKEIVKRCLEKQPTDRFSSAHDLALALRTVSSERGTGSASTPAQRPWQMWLSAHRTMAGALALLLVAAAFVGLVTWRPWKTKPSPAGTAGTVVPSLVALPCKVLGSPESAYLTDAVPSTISTLLGEVQGMDTKVPPTSFEVEKVHGDLDKIAEAYGVQTFVLSTATAEGDHLVFNIQLADARTWKVQWSHQYQGSRANYTAMAHEAAQGICKAVLPDAPPAVPTSGPTSNSEADLAFQQGKYYLLRYLGHRDRKDFDRALAAFNRALESNPKDAATAAWVSNSYFLAVMVGHIPRPQGLAQMQAWVERALALDARCSEALWMRAALETTKPDADLGKQIEFSLAAAQLGPRSAQAQDFFAIAGLASGGSLALAVEALREALRHDPLVFQYYMELADFLTRFGRPGEALPYLDTAQSLDPDNRGAPYERLYVLVEMGRANEAATLFKRLGAGESSGSIVGQREQDSRWVLSLAVDDDRDARSSLKAMMARFADPEANWNELQDDIHNLLPAVNRRFGKDAALDLLTLSTKRGATMPYDTLMLRPDLKKLREDPRAADVIKKTKVPFDLLMHILRDARTRGELPKYLEKPMDDLVRRLTEQGAWSG
jgi:tetratricopeptide (TPR) repeat protein